MKKTSAFTLIELLVVIAIIAILAGIALPVFQKVLEKGHVTEDCSNMRQLGIGTVAYLNDNSDTLFNKTTSIQGGSNSSQLAAPGLLQVNYVPSPKVFHSPFDKRPVGGNPNPISYGVNNNLLDPTSATPQWDSNFTKLAAASQLILYCPEYKGDPTNASSWTGVETTAISVTSNGKDQTLGTHQNGKWIDVLYADMHVGSIKLKDFQTTGDNSASGGIDGINQWQPMGHPAPGQ